MMRAAAAAVSEEAERLGIERPGLLAVTVLTSIDETAWRELGHTAGIGESVGHMARLAKAAGVDGIVSSPREAAEIRAVNGADFVIVTPGIRPAFAGTDDQRRIAAPAQALRNGASYLVIGRPITKAGDPRAAALSIAAEIEGV